MLRSRLNILVFLTVFFLTIGVVAVRRFQAARRATAESRVLLWEGFDFAHSPLHSPTRSEAGIGTRIDLKALQTSKQEAIGTVLGKKLLLMALIDPDCGPCHGSKDMIENIHAHTDELGIIYLPVVLHPRANLEPAPFVRELGFENWIQWDPNLALPEWLNRLGTPSHVLTNSDGVVLQVWPGTNVYAATRQRMAQQISSDLSLISEVLKANQTNN